METDKEETNGETQVETLPNDISLEQKGAAKDAEYNLFVKWTALPQEDKTKIRVLSQKDFCEKYNVNPKTLAAWKRRPNFWDQVSKETTNWARELTPTVLRSLFKRTLRQDFANPKDTELWLQYVEKFNPKLEIEHNIKSGIQLDDLRFLISYLPEEKQKEFYGLLGRLIQEAEYYRSLRENEVVSDDGQQVIEMDVSGSTGIVDAKNSAADKMAEEATSDIRGHLGQGS